MAEDAEQHEPIVPANHLRAVMFAFERLASSLKLRANGGVTRACYVLDCGMDKSSAPDLYNDVDSRPRLWSRFGSLAIDGLSMNGWKDPYEKIQKQKAKKEKRKKKTDVNDVNVAPRTRTIPGVLPHLEHHQTIGQGLPVLREALRQLTEYYPGLMEKVYFIHAPFSFRAFMKVFSLMVDAETANKFVVVPKGKEREVLGQVFHDYELPVEFGGKGPSLGRDDFLAHAMNRYEQEAKQVVQMLQQKQSQQQSTNNEQYQTEALLRSKQNDEMAGVASTKQEALSAWGGKLITNATGVRLFLSDDEDEVPLGQFKERIELVVQATPDSPKRSKLIWPISGWVEIP